MKRKREKKKHPSRSGRCVGKKKGVRLLNLKLARALAKPRVTVHQHLQKGDSEEWRQVRLTARLIKSTPSG